MEQQLEIVIPTYNRVENLNNTLNQIFNSNISDKVFVTVIDNCSPYKIESQLLPKAINNSNFRLLTNKTNIGLCGNILRCFESSRSKWLWVLGDDDDIDFNVLEEILPKLTGDYYNFSSEMYSRKYEIKGNGINDFVSNLDSYSNCLYISSNFYRIDAFLTSLSLGYMNTASLAPQIAILLGGLNNDIEFCLSNKILIRDREKSVPSWSVIEQSLNFTSHLFINPVVKSNLTISLFKKMTKNELPPLKLFLSFLMYTKKNQIKYSASNLLLKKIFSERYMFSSIFTKFKTLFFRLIFKIFGFKILTFLNFIKMSHKLKNIRS